MWGLMFKNSTAGSKNSYKRKFYHNIGFEHKQYSILSCNGIKIENFSKRKDFNL